MLNITPKAYSKIKFYTDNHHQEIGGMGITNTIDGITYVTDIFLLKQVCSSAETELDAEDLSKLEYALIKNKVKGNLNFWWHSHVNMHAEWSGQDKKQINELGSNGLIFALVINKSGSMKAAVCQKGDSYYPTFIDYNYPVSINDVLSKSERDLMLAEIKEKVSQQVCTYMQEIDQTKRGQINYVGNEYYQDHYSDTDTHSDGTYRENKVIKGNVRNKDRVTMGKIQEKKVGRR